MIDLARAYQPLARGAMVSEGTSAARFAMERGKGAVSDFFERATVRRYIPPAKEVRDFPAVEQVYCEVVGR